MIQNIIALVIVALAILYIGYTVWRIFTCKDDKKHGKCYGCTGCTLKDQILK